MNGQDSTKTEKSVLSGQSVFELIHIELIPFGCRTQKEIIKIKSYMKFPYLYPLKMNTQRIISSIDADCWKAQPDGNSDIEFYRPYACAEHSRGMVIASDYYPDVRTERSRSGMDGI